MAGMSVPDFEPSVSPKELLLVELCISTVVVELCMRLILLSIRLPCKTAEHPSGGSHHREEKRKLLRRPQLEEKSHTDLKKKAEFMGHRALCPDSVLTIFLDRIGRGPDVPGDT